MLDRKTNGPMRAEMRRTVDSLPGLVDALCGDIDGLVAEVNTLRPKADAWDRVMTVLKAQEERIVALRCWIGDQECKCCKFGTRYNPDGPCSRCQLVATWGGKVSKHPGLKGSEVADGP